MKVSRMVDDERCIILGVTDVDEQMKQRNAAARMEQEQVAYNRLSALAGDFQSIYVVNPVSLHYREFSASASFESVARSKEGENFFADSREEVKKVLYPEDQSRFFSAFTRENVFAEIERSGFFTVTYRLMIEGVPRYMQLKAVMVEEKEGKRLIVGVTDIDYQVRQEEDYELRLATARKAANADALTGVKNKHAYQDAEQRLNQRIRDREHPEFSVVILDVNNLKKVNDTLGHKAGDQLIRDACRIICTTFSHSPVFRVGGDEFAVISQGSDYEHIDELVQRIHEHNMESLRSGGVIVACGMAKYEGEDSVAQVFEHADVKMYENKSMLKAKKRAGG
jgi:diguanylate cyclase (GGDEF)-like protein